MPDEPLFRLHSVSVVVTAEFHNPSILNPDFLIAHGIVPASWAVVDSLATPPLGVVRYDNGVSLTVDQSRLTLTENANPRFGETHRVHDIGKSYLRELPHVPYRSLGLNCRVLARQANPRRWLVERFAASWLRDEPTIQGIRPKLTLLADDAVCHLDLLDARENDGGVVVADCNVHHAGPLDIDTMCAAIGRWPEREAFILSSLSTFWGTGKDEPV